MDLIPGMKDRYGGEVRRSRYFLDICRAAAESYGYEPLNVSLIERAEAYSEDIVGISPWPEWNARGCFFFNIDDYQDSYDEVPESQHAVLIPEGTLSVTRWLGAHLQGDWWKGADQLPQKIYYESQCFRNELVSSLRPGKGREFTQFGIEILGSGSGGADIEPMIIAQNILKEAANEDVEITFRISSNGIFLRLAEASGLTPLQRVHAKEALDTIAECKAGKRPERLPGASEELYALLSNQDVSPNVFGVWQYIIDRKDTEVTSRDLEILSSYDASEVSYLAGLQASAKNLQIEIDFCVVRSHEYYTGLTFEIDLIINGQRHVEVGGGGRYDRLLGNFISDGPDSIPCTGFAFGVDRLLYALHSNNALKLSPIPTARDISDDGIIECVDIPAAPFEDRGSWIAPYLELNESLADRRKNERVSVNIA